MYIETGIYGPFKGTGGQKISLRNRCLHVGPLVKNFKTTILKMCKTLKEDIDKDKKMMLQGYLVCFLFRTRISHFSRSTNLPLIRE